MYGHDGGFPEEYDINNEMECIKDFFNSGYSFADIVGEYIGRDVIKKTLFFSVGIEYKEKLFLYDSMADEWKEEGLQKTETIHDKYEQIEQHFLSLSGKEEFGYIICRCLTLYCRRKARCGSIGGPSGRLSTNFHGSVCDAVHRDMGFHRI